MQGTEYLEQNKFKISAKNSGYFLLIQQKKECKRTPFSDYFFDMLKVNIAFSSYHSGKLVDHKLSCSIYVIP